MLFTFAFGIDKDFIKIHCHENVNLFHLDLIYIVLEHSQCVNQSNRHYLVLEMAIVGLKGCLRYIAFSDPHLIVDISQIKFGETSSPI